MPRLPVTHRELDGEIVYQLATAFAQVNQGLSADQRTQLLKLRTDLLGDLAYPSSAYLYAQSPATLYDEFQKQSARFARSLGRTDYGNLEFVIEDCDGRWVAFGIKQSNAPKLTLKPLPAVTAERFTAKPALLKLALTHRSYLSVTGQGPQESNERLEFFGDSVLSYVVAERRYRDNPHIDEGALTEWRGFRVKRDSLAMFARRLDLGQHLQDLVARHLERQRLRGRPARQHLHDVEAPGVGERTQHADDTSLGSRQIEPGGRHGHSSNIG